MSTHYNTHYTPPTVLRTHTMPSKVDSHGIEFNPLNSTDACTVKSAAGNMHLNVKGEDYIQLGESDSVKFLKDIELHDGSNSTTLNHTKLQELYDAVFPTEWADVTDASIGGSYATGIQSYLASTSFNGFGIRYRKFTDPTTSNVSYEVHLKGTVKKTDSSNIPNDTTLLTLPAFLRPTKDVRVITYSDASVADPHHAACAIVIQQDGDVVLYRRLEDISGETPGVVDFVVFDTVSYFTNNT